MLADPTWGAPMICSLSPTQFSWESVWLLFSVLLLPLEPRKLSGFPLVLVSATRFRSLPQLKMAVLFHPSLKLLTHRTGLNSGWATSHCFLIFRPRDRPCHSTKPSFPRRARFALLNSSGLILRLGRHARAQLA